MVKAGISDPHDVQAVPALRAINSRLLVDYMAACQGGIDGCPVQAAVGGGVANR